MERLNESGELRDMLKPYQVIFYFNFFTSPSGASSFLNHRSLPSGPGDRHMYWPFIVFALYRLATLSLSNIIDLSKILSIK